MNTSNAIDLEINATMRVLDAVDELYDLDPAALVRSLDWIARMATERAVEIRQLHPELPANSEF